MPVTTGALTDVNRPVPPAYGAHAELLTTTSADAVKFVLTPAHTMVVSFTTVQFPVPSTVSAGHAHAPDSPVRTHTPPMDSADTHDPKHAAHPTPRVKHVPVTVNARV